MTLTTTPEADTLFLNTDLDGLVDDDMDLLAASLGYPGTKILGEPFAARDGNGGLLYISNSTGLDMFLFGTIRLELVFYSDTNTLHVRRINKEEIASTSAEGMTWEQVFRWCRMVAALHP